MKTFKILKPLVSAIIILLLSNAVALSQATSEKRGNGIEFVKNKGQIVDQSGKKLPEILYSGDGGGASIYLRQGGVSYVIKKIEDADKLEEAEEEMEARRFNKNKIREVLDSLQETMLVKIQRMDMEFTGSNKQAKIIEEEPTEGYLNYYLSHCPNGITGVKGYNKITYQEIYPKIDVCFLGGKAEGMEYDFVIKPGGDPNNISIKYQGTDNLMLTAEGRLKIQTSIGEIKEWIPKIYQNINNQIVNVVGSYKLEGNKLQFNIGNYDKNAPLIIDPWTTWITFYGGVGNEFSYSVNNDANGNVLVTGWTPSTNFPLLSAFQTTYGGNSYDAYIVKFNSGGVRQWATYYGGSSSDYGYNIATDATGNVFVSGSTASSTNFPTQSIAGGYNQMTYGGGTNDAFLLKLNASGVRQWATYYGGSTMEFGAGVATDAGGNVFITGNTTSTNFPVLSGFQMTYGGGANDAFVAKFNGSGARQWASYCGGNLDDPAYNIAVDQITNEIYFTGNSLSANFPVTAGSFQTVNAGGTSYGDAYLVKLTSSGTIDWATFCGGSDDDNAHDLAISPSSYISVTGTTYSFDFPGNGSTSLSGTTDAYVANFDAYGSFIWSYYFGGWSVSGDEGMGVAMGANNWTYIFGDTYGSGIPNPGGPSCQPSFAGIEDNYFASFDDVGNLMCSTYLGGTFHEEGGSGKPISVFGSFAYITANTYATNTNYPVTAGSYQTVNAGGSDVVVAQLPLDCSCGAVLPSELISFEGINQGAVNILKWETGSEINNDFFTVERSSNGKKFESVGIIKGAGNSSNMLNYSFIDHEPFSGINYYRLKQTGYDRKYTYSNVIPINTNSEPCLKIFPNPADKENINLILMTPSATKLFIVISDIAGREIFSKTLSELQDGKFLIKTDKLSRGIYFVTVTVENKMYRQKLITY